MTGRGSRTGRLRWHVWLFVGVAGVAGAITLLFHVMSSVMEVGGSCGSGGPYVIRTECPGGVVPSAMLSIFGGLASVGLSIGAAAKLGAPQVVLLAWPGLFGLLGVNFLRYGIDPPIGSGPEIGLLVTGVVFVLMAVVPLWIGAATVRDRWRVRRRGGSMPSVGVPTVRVSSLRSAVSPAASPVTPPIARQIAEDVVVPPQPDWSAVASGDDPGLVDGLARLAEMRRRGDLTEAEFTAAKRALLSGDA